MSDDEKQIADARLDTIAGKITQGIYHAPLDRATERQRNLALTVASNVATALSGEAALAAEVARYRAGLIAIQNAFAAGKVCDNIAWFDDIDTLHDYIEGLMSPSAPAAVADLFERSAA